MELGAKNTFWHEPARGNRGTSPHPETSKDLCKILRKLAVRSSYGCFARLGAVQPRVHAPKKRAAGSCGAGRAASEVMDSIAAKSEPQNKDKVEWMEKLYTAFQRVLIQKMPLLPFLEKVCLCAEQLIENRLFEIALLELYERYMDYMCAPPASASLR